MTSVGLHAAPVRKNPMFTRPVALAAVIWLVFDSSTAGYGNFSGAKDPSGTAHQGVMGGAVFAAQAIYDEIQNAVPPPSKEETDLDWLVIMTNVMEITAKLSPEGEAQAAALSIMGSSMDITQILMEAADGSEADDVVAGSAGELTDQLALPQRAAVQGIDRLETILLTDYGKLATVGGQSRRRRCRLDDDVGHHHHLDRCIEREHPSPVREHPSARDMGRDRPRTQPE